MHCLVLAVVTSCLLVTTATSAVSELDLWAVCGVFGAFLMQLNLTNNLIGFLGN